MESNNKIDDKISKMLKFDSLAEAEKLTGESYKESERTGFLGMAIQMKKSAEMNHLMEITDDTKFSEKSEDYLKKVLSYGFEIIHQSNFKGSEGVEESYFILFLEKYGIILTFDTFQGSRNSANFYYNWMPNNRGKMGLTSSGSYYGNGKDIVVFDKDFKEQDISEWKKSEPIFNDVSWDEYIKLHYAWKVKYNEWLDKNEFSYVWVGSHDGREAIKFNIDQLAKNGKFMKTWIENPYIHFNNYSDWDVESEGYEYQDKVSNDKKYLIIDKLPKNFFADE